MHVFSEFFCQCPPPPFVGQPTPGYTSKTGYLAYQKIVQKNNLINYLSVRGEHLIVDHYHKDISFSIQIHSAGSLD